MPMPGHVIIGVHGLSAKPPEKEHREAWCLAICEGLQRNLNVSVAPERLGLELVYWADWLDRPATEPGKDEEPYLPAEGNGPLPSYRQRWFDDDLRKVLDRVANPIDWAKSAPPTDWIREHTGLDDVGVLLLQKRLVDLGTYYDNPQKRALLRKRLVDALVRNEGKRIMLVAHSMGSIVAYDVLRDFGRERPAATIDHLVTLGSPLGLPYVVDRIRQENAAVRTPSIVQRWTNQADRRDPVAIDVHLGDEYEPSDSKVAVADALVVNTYRSPQPKNKRNHHKIYGYLRTPEFSRLVSTFI
jgi:hypothetical protein